MFSAVKLIETYNISAKGWESQPLPPFVPTPMSYINKAYLRLGTIQQYLLGLSFLEGKILNLGFASTQIKYFHPHPLCSLHCAALMSVLSSFLWDMIIIL